MLGIFRRKSHSKETLFQLVKRKTKKFFAILFGNKDYQKYVILGRQRTGSSLLESLLRSHTNIEAVGEPFQILENRTTQEILDNIFSKRLPWINLVGFRLFYYHPEDSSDRSIWNYVKNDTSIKIIHIKRRNLLRTHISKLIAQKTGAWTSHQKTTNSKPNRDKSVYADPDECIKEFGRIKVWEEKYSSEKFPNHDYMEIIYEDFIRDIPGNINKVFDFLGVSKKSVGSPYKKQNPEKAKDLIINYKELESQIKDSKFEYLLELEN